MKILAIKWRRLGDTVLWTSALQALKDLPGLTQLDIAFPADYSELFLHDSRFHEQFPIPQRREDRKPFLKQWPSAHYDFALSFHSSSRSRELAKSAGAKETLVHHHSRSGRNFGSSRPIPNLGTVMAAAERDLNVVRALGWTGTRPETKIYPSEAHSERARHRLKERGRSDQEKLVWLGIHASRPSKLWPLQNYLQLIRNSPPGIRFGVLVDSLAAFRGYSTFQEEIEKHAWVIETPKLSDLMGYLKQGDLFVGSDSGVKHLACALDVPTLTLFGPESLGEWHFYPEPRHLVIQKTVACRNRDPEPQEFAWCGEATCPLASHACMALISTEEVSMRIEKALKSG